MTEYLSEYEVTDRKSFGAFIKLLRQDLISNPASWQNKNLEEFFEAMSRYTEDIQAYYNNTNQNVNADDANWQTFADIFKGASMYE